MDAPSMARAVRELRDEKGLTQVELAQRAGIRQPTISQIETGQRAALGPDVLAGLAQGLGVSVDYLLQRAGVLAPVEDLRMAGASDPELNEVARTWPYLPKAFRAGLLASIRAYRRAEAEAEASSAQVIAEEEPEGYSAAT